MKLPEDQVVEQVKQDKQTEAKYPRAELIQNAQAIFKVAPEVVAGALYGNLAEELPLQEVKKAISTFLKKKHVPKERKVK